MTFTVGLLVTVIVTVLGASFQFYNCGVVNTPQAIVQSWMNETYYARHVILSEISLTTLWSFFVSVICIGAMCGSLATPFVAEKIGRKNGLIFNGLINVVGGIMEMESKSANSPELLFVGRFVLGFCVGLSSGLAPMYLTEIAPISQRGASGTAHQIASAFADWFSLFLTLPFVMGGADLWPIAFGFAAFPAALMIMILPFCYESPRFILLSKNDKTKAEKAVKFFSTGETAAQTFQDMITEVAIVHVRLQRKGKPKISDFFVDRSLRTPLLISVFVMFAQQFTGCAAVFSYSTDMFVQADITIEIARLCTLAVGICYFLCTLPAVFYIEKAGRRKLLLIQLVGCALSLTLVTIFISLKHRYHYDWASYAAIGGLVAYMCIYGLGSPVPWLIASELFSQEYRSIAVMFNTFTAWLGAFIVVILYLPFQRTVSVEFSFLPFIAVLVIAVIVIYLLLPETKNKSVEEIVHEFQNKHRRISRRLTNPLNLKEDETQPLLGSYKIISGELY